MVWRKLAASVLCGKELLELRAQHPTGATGVESVAAFRILVTDRQRRLQLT